MYIVNYGSTQLRQKSHTRNIGVTGSLSTVPYTRDPVFSKSATIGPNTSLHSLSRPSPSTSSQDFRGHSLMSITQGHSVEMSVPLGRKMPAKAEEMDDEEDDNSNHILRPVPTDFCDWCCKYFANSLTKVKVIISLILCYSLLHCY